MKLAQCVCAIWALASMPMPAAFADGESCSAQDVSRSNGPLKKAEEAERAGRLKEAYAIVDQGIPVLHCAGNGYHRRDGIIERTSRKLGAEAEKAGQFGDAFKYFSAPYRHGRVDYPLGDADRAMLKYAKANPGSYKAVSEAMAYFDRREGKPHVNEVRALARDGGNKALSGEAKAFAGVTRDSRKELEEARDWFRLAGDEKPVNARAEQRGDSLLADSTVRSIELAMQYYGFAHNKAKGKQAEERARRLGDEAARKGDHALATRFYALSGDTAKASAVEKQIEQAESKRQQQFKKDQQSLEKELGL